MNIFYLDEDAKRCAVCHMNKHVVKMILEYSQLLSTAHRVLDGEQQIIKKEYIPELGLKRRRNMKIWKLNDERDQHLYRATHINHPSAIWVRESVDHYDWLLDLLSSLHEEYTFRYEKFHKSLELLSSFIVEPDNIPLDKGFKPPPQAMPDQYKMSDTVRAYRNYYCNGKSHLAKWKNRQPPSWFNLQTK